MSPLYQFNMNICTTYIGILVVGYVVYLKMTGLTPCVSY